MDIHTFEQARHSQNKMMSENDEFFKQFGELDNTVYSEGAIPKKYKEHAGLSISVFARCEECVMYHVKGCVTENATKFEIIEAIKIAVIGGGSITYPTARFAFKALKALGVLE